MTLSTHTLVTALQNDRDALASSHHDLIGHLMRSEQLLEDAYGKIEILERTIRQYDLKLLELSEQHATAVFAVQELTAALRRATGHLVAVVP